MTEERKTVVCVEREHGTFKACSRELNAKFHDKIEIVHFGTAKEAEAYLSSGKADLIISSLLQAQIDGIDLLNNCKDLYPSIPFIIYTNLEYKDEFFAWGHKPDAYVVRSSDHSELISAVGKFLGFI